MIEKTLVLSTAHISMATNETLTNLTSGKKKVEYFPRIQSHEYGYLIFIGSEPYERVFGQMLELYGIIEFAQKSNCSIINLDADAEEIDGLPVFDWDVKSNGVVSI